MVFKYLIVHALLLVAFADYVGGQAISNTMDGNYVFYQKGFNPSDSQIGLPSSGVIHGSADSPVINVHADSASTFLLQPYTANNVLLLEEPGVTIRPPGVQSGTMTFVTPTLANSLAFMTSAGFGPNQLTATVHFSDGTPDIVSTLNSPNWAGSYPDLPSVASAGGRLYINYPNPQLQHFDGSWALIYEVAIPLGLEAAHPVSSIDLQWLASSTSFGLHKVAIFGISTSTTSAGPYTYANLTPSSFNADVVMEVPEPTSVGVLAGVAILGVRRRRCCA